MTIDDRLETALRSAYTRHAGDELHELRYEPPMGFSRSRSRWRAPVALTLVRDGHRWLDRFDTGPARSDADSPKGADRAGHAITVGHPPTATGRHRCATRAVRKALVTADGDTIYTTAIGGGCIRTAILTATETSTEVVLHLNAYTAADKDTGCTLNLDRVDSVDHTRDSARWSPPHRRLHRPSRPVLRWTQSATATVPAQRSRHANQLLRRRMDPHVSVPRTTRCSPDRHLAGYD